MCLFADIYGFTALSESMSPSENFEFINAVLGRVGPIIRAHNGFTDKYIGDAIMALFPGNPGDAVRAAVDMQNALRVYNARRAGKGFADIEVGVGIHTGNLMLGTVGESERMDSTVISDAVNAASRLEHLTRHYQRHVLVTQEAVDEITEQTGLAFEYVDTLQVRGRKSELRVYAVSGVD
ncbi:MAG: adenylate/guanylate cyclase domain-containing protein [Spirochaetia bacterium]|nr:adenylate/guanylate cyclase domain-containing protein [Spirochaetia bacterium]